jgi:ribosomal protein S18 acetylase RimI-like enzyme
MTAAPTPTHPAAQAVSIRRAGPEDAETLSRLGEATFRETWLVDHKMPYATEDLPAALEAMYGLEPTRALLADPAMAFWLAEREGAAVAYALAGACTLPYPDVKPGCGELKRLYVARSARGGGLGERLLREALAWLERDGPRRIWIGVWSGNVGAQRLYGRYGFEKVGEHTFTVGRTVDREFALRRG